MLNPGAFIRRRWKLIALVCGLSLVLALALVPWLSDSETTPAARPNQAPPRSTQWSLQVDALHINAPLKAIGETYAGTLDPPSNPHDVGWWTGSAPPGAKSGQTIITGHTVHTGGGQMDHLGSIPQGATIIVHAKDGATYYYRETKVETIPKPDVSLRRVELFGQTDAPNRLVLITCSGWTGSGYLYNVFVYATPIGAPVGATT